MVHWMLEETGAPYEVELLNFTTREHNSAEFLRADPMGKIPASVHRNTVVAETPATCTYLADAFPAARLATDDPARGTYLRWLFLGYGCLEPATDHGSSANYDYSKTITLVRTVTEFRWRNPHSALFIDVKGKDGKIINYAIELPSPTLLSRGDLGWADSAYKAPYISGGPGR